MTKKMDFIKTTVIGGIFFLIPLAIVLIVVGKLVEVMRAVARGLSPVLAVETPLGTLVLNIIGVCIILGLCFLAGLVARKAKAKNVVERLEATLLAVVPGYAFIKGFSDNLRRSDELAGSFLPVAVHFDDYSQIAFEIERQQDGKVAVYLPGAPNPWSGSVVYVTEERVMRLSITLNEALKNIRMLGKGTSALQARQKNP